MNPYECDPTRILAEDAYTDLPLYGRYSPNDDDFRVDLRFANSTSAEPLAYWNSVVALCTPDICIYPADEGGRDVFALGTVIVKSSHLHAEEELDWTFADANESKAIELAKAVLLDIKIPEIYFTGKVSYAPALQGDKPFNKLMQINGRQVLVQERIPGTGLNVSCPYLTDDEKYMFKTQARDVICRLQTIPIPSSITSRNHVVPDADVRNKPHKMTAEEATIIFDENLDDDFGFMHNDLSDSNIIVDKDRIMGIIDWERAAYIGRRTAAEIHCRIRTPQLEHYKNVQLSDEKLNEMMWWNDLYD